MLLKELWGFRFNEPEHFIHWKGPKWNGLPLGCKCRVALKWSGIFWRASCIRWGITRNGFKVPLICHFMSVAVKGLHLIWESEYGIFWKLQQDCARRVSLGTKTASPARKSLQAAATRGGQGKAAWSHNWGRNAGWITDFFSLCVFGYQDPNLIWDCYELKVLK